MARMSIRIFPDGKVQGDIQGLQGKKCTNYIKIIEALVNGQTLSSEYTDEFYEQEMVQQRAGLEDDLALRVDDHG